MLYEVITGGLGSLLSLAQSNLGENDFSTLANSLPDTASLLAAVPVTDADSGMSGLLSKAGALGVITSYSIHYTKLYEAFCQTDQQVDDTGGVTIYLSRDGRLLARFTLRDKLRPAARA